MNDPDRTAHRVPGGFGLWLAGLLALGYGFLLWLATWTKQWFYADEWEFITTRARPSGLGAIADVYLRPHNEHWSTFPILVYRAIFGVVGLKAYWPYLGVHLAFHIVLALLFARHLRYSGAQPIAVLALTAVFVVLGAGVENIMWAFQFAWIAAIAFGFVGLEVVRRGRMQWSRAQLGALWLVGIAALTCAAVGVSVVAALGAAVLLRHGWRRGLQTVAVPAAVQIAWTLAYGRTGAERDPIDWGYSPYRIPGYAWRAFVSLIEDTTGLRGVGPVVIFGCAFLLARYPGSFFREHAESTALAIGALVFVTLVALGRVPFDDPEASRYAYVLYALVVPILTAAVRTFRQSLGSDGGIRRASRWLAVVGFVVVLAHSLGLLIDVARQEGVREQAMKRNVQAAFSIADSAFAANNAIPEERAPDLTMRGVRRLVSGGVAVPGRVDDVSLAAVAGVTSVDMTPQPVVPLNRSAIVIGGLGRAVSQPIESECTSVAPAGPQPQFALLPRRPASIKMVPSAGGKLIVVVRRNGNAAPPREFPVAANNPVFLNFADPRNEYVLSLPGDASVKICGVGTAS